MALPVRPHPTYFIACWRASELCSYVKTRRLRHEGGAIPPDSAARAFSATDALTTGADRRTILGAAQPKHSQPMPLLRNAASQTDKAEGQMSRDSRTQGRIAGPSAA